MKLSIINYQLSITLVLILLVGGCGLTSPYKVTSHHWYAKELSQDQKDSIEKNGQILIDVESVMDNGKILILKNEYGRAKYRFIKIGKWESEYGPDTYNENRIKDKSQFDQYGNKREQITYMNTIKNQEYYLSHLWESEFRVIDGDSILVQNISAFTRDGFEWYKESRAVLNYKELVDDRLKVKYKIDTAWMYDKNKKLESLEYHLLSDSVKVKFLPLIH